MASIELEGVWKTFPDGFEAVRGVDLSVGSGEFVVLVGPSGCGKSTTLRMIAGLEQASHGQIRIGDRVVNDVHPKDRDIAMVFQNYALYPHMTVFENMAFGLKLRKVSRAEVKRRVLDAARILGLEDMLDRKPRVLSGGQRQRVAVGRAIVREPAAFLFDEPLSNLDAKLRVATRSEFKALRERLQTTTVYVTHDQEEAMTLGDRLVVMSKGEIQQVGSPFEVYNAPINRFVATFIGTPPMNFFSGRVERSGRCMSFSMGQGQGGGASGSISAAVRPLKVEIAADAAASLAGGWPQTVMLGIRPTDAAVVPAGSALQADDLELSVELVEPLGGVMDVHGTVASGERAVFRVEASSDIPVRSVVRLRLDTSRVYLFEPGEFGGCLLSGGGRGRSPHESER